MIADRYCQAILQCNTFWGDYMRRDGQTIEATALYYVDQQANQLKLLFNSDPACTIFDTTHHDYDQIVAHVRSSLGDSS